MAPGNNGAQCDDSDPCTYFGSCSNGMCMKGQPIDCSFLDGDCSLGMCVPGSGCTPVAKNDGAACEDGQYCTGNDTCQAGACVGGAGIPCAPPGGCFVGTCDEINNTCTAVPGNDGAACDDGSPCTDTTTCAAGVCMNGTPVNDGMACDDGTGCTMGESCSAGLCTGGTGPAIYFADDFKDTSKGWTLGPEWEIGPAMSSSPLPDSGYLDPASDHTNTADNGVAGVAIGGNAESVLHPYYWMESPAFDTSGATGPVVLGFYRHLNTDYDPWMHNAVEVYNGTQWVNLWTSFDSIEESAWTYQQFDLTSYKSPTMRIRFGFDIMDVIGLYSMSSWNVDDVLVASAACP